MVWARRAQAVATTMCGLLWSLLAVLQGTAGGDTRAAQPLALTLATAVAVLAVSVALWLAALGTPVPAVGFVLTGLAVAVPLLLIIALRTSAWSRLDAEVDAIEAGLASLVGAH
ncbi:hypothetical protein CLV37_13111 [Kineococcus rhizosphaerae]|uniref:Uncharacterized protein n=2 Tax=Kineococcus rhizosphaerae TaxID=559628 RepID=A0A2T0QQ11_9ACTN|nr:hypothetical protein CLV37_13111 [Kineococcus rhizosphaerae]